MIFFTIFIIANRFTELPAVLKSIDEELKRKTIPNNTGRITDQGNDGANGFENKVMRIKASIGEIWENKLQARKSAYWGYVRNTVETSDFMKNGCPLILVLLYQ